MITSCLRPLTAVLYDPASSKNVSLHFVGHVSICTWRSSREARHHSSRNFPAAFFLSRPSAVRLCPLPQAHFGRPHLEARATVESWALAAWQSKATGATPCSLLKFRTRRITSSINDSETLLSIWKVDRDVPARSA